MMHSLTQLPCSLRQLAEWKKDLSARCGRKNERASEQTAMPERVCGRGTGNTCPLLQSRTTARTHMHATRVSIQSTPTGTRGTSITQLPGGERERVDLRLPLLPSGSAEGVQICMIHLCVYKQAGDSGRCDSPSWQARAACLCLCLHRKRGTDWGSAGNAVTEGR